MIRYFFLLALLSCSDARKHKLNLKDDDRKTVSLSTFGFLTGGTLAVNVTLSGVSRENAKKNASLFGFTLDKSTSPGLSRYMEEMQNNKCILNNSDMENKNGDNVESVFFKFDFPNLRLNFERVGSSLGKLVVTNLSQEIFKVQHHLHRRSAHTHASKLSDALVLSGHRSVRAVVHGKEENADPSRTPNKATDTGGGTPVSKTTPAPDKTPQNASKTGPDDAKTGRLSPKTEPDTAQMGAVSAATSSEPTSSPSGGAGAGPSQAFANAAAKEAAAPLLTYTDVKEVGEGSYQTYNDVDRGRGRVANLKAVQNTRKQHSFRMISPGVVACRERSCFCKVCLGTEEGVCEKAELTGEWQVIHLLKGQRGCRTVEVAQEAGVAAPPPADDFVPAPPPADDFVPAPPPVDDCVAAPPAADDHLATPAPADEFVAAPSPTDDSVAALPVQEYSLASQPTADQDDSVEAPPTQPSLAPGTFIKVMVLPASGLRNQGKVFMAAVKRVLDRERLHVSFLRHHSGRQYYYPAIEDESVVLRGEIEKIMPEPHFDRRGHLYFD